VAYVLGHDVREVARIDVEELAVHRHQEDPDDVDGEKERDDGRDEDGDAGDHETVAELTEMLDE